MNHIIVTDVVIPNQVYGGKDDLTAAMGYEEGGVTTVAFRRKLAASEPSDHPIEKGLFQVIWSHGQPQGGYQHRPSSGLERGEPSVRDFYKDDELKYHGRASYRGKFLLDFRAAPESKGAAGSASFRFPPGCSGGDCTYSAEVKVGGDYVDVEVTNKVGEDMWTAVGFSNDQSMVRCKCSRLYYSMDNLL